MKEAVSSFLDDIDAVNSTLRFPSISGASLLHSYISISCDSMVSIHTSLPPHHRVTSVARLDCIKYLDSYLSIKPYEQVFP